MFAVYVDEKGHNFQLIEARQHRLKSVDLQYFIQIRLAFTSLQHLEAALLRHLVQFPTFTNVDFLFSFAPQLAFSLIFSSFSPSQPFSQRPYLLLSMQKESILLLFDKFQAILQKKRGSYYHPQPQKSTFSEPMLENGPYLKGIFIVNAFF